MHGARSKERRHVSKVMFRKPEPLAGRARSRRPLPLRLLPIVRPLPAPTSTRSCCHCRGERRGAAGGEVEHGSHTRWASLVAAHEERGPLRARAVDGDAVDVGFPCDHSALWPTGGGEPRLRRAAAMVGSARSPRPANGGPERRCATTVARGRVPARRAQVEHG